MFASDAKAALIFFIYLATCAGLIALVDRLTGWPKEWIRKSYHLMITFSMLFLVMGFPNWSGAVLTLVGLMLFAFVVIRVAYKLQILQDLSIDRKKGSNEVSRQIFYLSVSFSGLLIVFWGILGAEWKFVAVLATMIWGFGDAAAALAGKFLGRTKLKAPFFDPKKTVEGALANVGASWIIAFLVLLVFTTVSWWVALVSAFILASVGSIIEAASRKGRDTIILPWSMAALAYPILQLLVFLDRWWRGG